MQTDQRHEEKEKEYDLKKIIRNINNASFGPCELSSTRCQLCSAVSGQNRITIYIVKCLPMPIMSKMPSISVVKLKHMIAVHVKTTLRLHLLLIG